MKQGDISFSFRGEGRRGEDRRGEGRGGKGERRGGERAHVIHKCNI